MDVRLAADGGLNDLAERISEALPADDYLIAIAQEIGVSYAKYVKGGTAHQRWSSFIQAVGDSHKVDELIDVVQKTLGVETKSASIIGAWRERLAGANLAISAIQECRSLVEKIQVTKDPRFALSEIKALSETLSDLARALSGPEIEQTLFGGFDSARGSVLNARAAVRRASSDIDQLFIGVDLAGVTLGRASSRNPLESFAAEMGIVGHLLDARMRVDQSMSDLLELFFRAMPKG